MTKLFLVSVPKDGKDHHISVGAMTPVEALRSATKFVGAPVGKILSVKSPELGTKFSPELLLPSVVKIVERDEARHKAAQRHERHLRRLAKEEAERQAKAKAHAQGVGPKGMGGQKTAQTTRPDSRKGRKQARLRANRK